MDDNDTKTPLIHLLNEQRKFPPLQSFQSQAYIQSLSDYKTMYERSLADADSFWLEHAESLHWIRKPSIAGEHTWNAQERLIENRWFADGILNATENCLDRHLALGRKDKTAIIWQGDAPKECQHISFGELHKKVCTFANVLKAHGIKKGDRVCIYLPMIPEVAIAMLAVARIGAIHSIVFAGFSAESLIHRINDSGCKMIITANEGIRGGHTIPLKNIVDEASLRTPSVETIVVVARTATPVTMRAGKDFWYHEEISKHSSDCPAEPLNAEDPLFILYTSGSTGKPKGVVHTQAGYLLHVSLSHRYIFDIHEEDVYWCTADAGWITGHSYGIYGPLANGCTTLLFEGVPSYPDVNRLWEIIDTFKVTVFYTAPTVLRAIIAQGSNTPQQHDLSSLKILGTVGEPINPEVWMWYYTHVGNSKCPVVDTWWQTETGGIMIAPLPGCHNLKPGSAIRPFFGIDPVVVRNDGTECSPGEGGNLCVRRSWPGIMRTTWGDHDRFIDTYFTAFKNLYFTGDGCCKDSEGDYWLLGRIDDIVNVSGHRIGTAEVESALVSHKSVAEAAVVPIPDEIKGEALYAFVTLLDDTSSSETLKADLISHVRHEIGPIATPAHIHFASALPKTRSGKIMRRILRKIAEGNVDQLGDISTLSDPSTIEALIRSKPQ